jgi:hypothetical protein
MEKNTHSLQKHSGESMVVPGGGDPPPASKLRISPIEISTKSMGINKLPLACVHPLIANKPPLQLFFFL